MLFGVFQVVARNTVGDVGAARPHALVGHMYMYVCVFGIVLGRLTNRRGDDRVGISGAAANFFADDRHWDTFQDQTPSQMMILHEKQVYSGFGVSSTLGSEGTTPQTECKEGVRSNFTFH